MLREILSVLILLNPFVHSSLGESGGGGGAPVHKDWYTGQHTNAIPVYPQQASPYTGGGQALARDSYVEAAASSGSDGGHGGHGQAMRYHYQMYPMERDQHMQQYAPPMNNYGTPSPYGAEEESFEGNSAGGGSGAIGLLGLLGLKGLKGVKAAIPFLFPIILPLLLPLFLILLLPLLLPLAALLLLFIPVPVVTVPPARMFNTARELRELAMADDCIERISCEATRFARSYGFNPSWVQEFLEKSSSPNTQWIERVSKGIRSLDCQKFTCSPSTVLKKSLNSAKQVESAPLPPPA